MFFLSLSFVLVCFDEGLRSFNPFPRRSPEKAAGKAAKFSAVCFSRRPARRAKENSPAIHRWVSCRRR
jgi:hypothetical protein